MKPSLRIASLALALPILAAAAGVQVGREAPGGSDCSALSNGNIYVRSQDPANAPVGVFRCTQVSALKYAWQPVGHFVGATLPGTCSTGDIAYKTDATSGSGLYACTSGSWVAQQGGWTDNGTTVSTSRNVATENMHLKLRKTATTYIRPRASALEAKHRQIARHVRTQEDLDSLMLKMKPESREAGFAAIYPYLPFRAIRKEWESLTNVSEKT